MARACSSFGEVFRPLRRSRPCSRRQPFYGENAAGVLGHFPQTLAGRRRHRHVVFLVGGGRQAVHRMRMGQRLVLAGQCRGGHLGDHEAGVHAAIGHQERRQLRHVLVHHQRDAAFAQRADFGDGQGHVVGGHGHRFGVEVAAGNHVAFGGEHQRVVGDGVGFDRQHFGGLTELGQAGAHDLRLATQGVRVLDLLAVLVRVGDFAALAQQIAISGSRVDLAFLATGRVNAGVERRARTQYRFNGQAAQSQGTGEQVLTFEQTAQSERRGHLRAVEQRQAFFAARVSGVRPATFSASVASIHSPL